LEAQRPLDPIGQEAKGSGGFNSQEKMERRQKRLEEFLKKYTDLKGRVRQDLWLKGIKNFQQMKVATTTLAPSGKSKAAAVPVVGLRWVQIGPQPLRNASGEAISGQVTDIVIDPLREEATSSANAWPQKSVFPCWQEQSYRQKKLCLL
jgi:hypothetical protein